MRLIINLVAKTRGLMQDASSPVGEDTEARPPAADAEVGEGRGVGVFALAERLLRKTETAV